MKRKEHLSVYGIGPLYGAVIIIVTVLGIIPSTNNSLASGSFQFLQIPFLIIGAHFISFGIALLIAAVVVARIDENIKSNQLVTTGVYAYVRNPVYSALMIACTGAVLCANNLWLLFLPFTYWAFLTLLLKKTEEKWLSDLYGRDYLRYCERVNRCIPWFSRNRH